MSLWCQASLISAEAWWTTACQHEWFPARLFSSFGLIFSPFPYFFISLCVLCFVPALYTYDLTERSRGEQYQNAFPARILISVCCSFKHFIEDAFLSVRLVVFLKSEIIWLMNWNLWAPITSCFFFLFDIFWGGYVSATFMAVSVLTESKNEKFLYIGVCAHAYLRKNLFGVHVQTILFKILLFGMHIYWNQQVLIKNQIIILFVAPLFSKHIMCCHCLR